MAAELVLRLFATALRSVVLARSSRVTSARFPERELREADLDPTIQDILEQVKPTGSCQDAGGAQELRDVFVVSSDIEAEGHIRMQAALQPSSMPASARQLTFQPPLRLEDVADALHSLWNLGCKGLDCSCGRVARKRGPGDDRDAPAEDQHG